MDWWRIIVILVLIIIIGALVNQLLGLEIFGGVGRQMLEQLQTPGQNSSGVSVGWSPASVSTVLFTSLFVRLGGDGVSVDVWAVVLAGFAAALIVVGIALIIKMLGKVTGG